MGFVNWLMQYRNELEVIYFLSGPLMFLGVVIAWLQLMSIRRNIRVKNKREAIREVFETLKDFGKATDIKYELDCKLDGAGLLSNMPKISGFNYSDLPPNCAWSESYRENSDCYNLGIDLINFIEPVAQRILSGLADEKYAYKVEGYYFFGLLENNKAIIACHREKGHEDAFKDSIELYDLWKARKAKDDARAELYTKLRSFLKMPRDRGRKTIA